MVRFGWEVRVECYEGHRGQEEPRRFHWAGRRLEITEILDRWLDPSHRYFKVLTEDAGVHLLRHDGESGRWEVRGVTGSRR